MNETSEVLSTLKQIASYLRTLTFVAALALALGLVAVVYVKFLA